MFQALDAGDLPRLNFRKTFWGVQILVHTPHAYGPLAASAATVAGAPAGYIEPALSIGVVGLIVACLPVEVHDLRIAYRQV